VIAFDNNNNTDGLKNIENKGSKVQQPKLVDGAKSFHMAIVHSDTSFTPTGYANAIDKKKALFSTKGAWGSIKSEWAPFGVDADAPQARKEQKGAAESEHKRKVVALVEVAANVRPSGEYEGNPHLIEKDHQQWEIKKVVDMRTAIKDMGEAYPLVWRKCNCPYFYDNYDKAENSETRRKILMDLFSTHFD
jgi:hypothetical protein